MPAKHLPKGGAAPKPAPATRGSPTTRQTGSTRSTSDDARPSQTSVGSDSQRSADVSEIEDPDVEIPELGDMTAGEWIAQQELVNEYIEDDRVFVPFTKLTFDEDMKAGQCREKDKG
jgi:hypothetical protein